MKLDLLALGVLLALISSVSADYWEHSISTNSSSWSIYRQSGNISFNLSSLVEGDVSPAELHGRVLGAYQSRYTEVAANDVRLRERTSSLEGKYRSEDKINLQSRVNDEIYIDTIKPAGTNVYTFIHSEYWPVLLIASRTLEYSGRQINDRDFEGNNRDYVDSNLLYNHALAKERTTVMWLDRMNATVLATDDAILQADFMPTKYLGYLVRAKTTGIADLRYRQTGRYYDVKRRDYPAIIEGYERYYGTYTIGRKIEMRSVFENSTETEDWLPCCYGGWIDMSLQDRRGHGADKVFNCSCYQPSALTL